MATTPRSKLPDSSFAVPSRRAYPVNTPGRAKNAIARVQQFGSTGEKKKVFAKVKKRYPAIANRSRVIPTKTGSGRRYGQPPTKAGGVSVPGTVRRRRGGGSVTRKPRVAGSRRAATKPRVAGTRRAPAKPSVAGRKLK